MLSKRYESTKVDRRTELKSALGALWCTISGINQEVEI